ncbi:hypothetical protein NIES2101_09465 [Calothrix sp. HK-06]|nr:hypothetical protein NIES2101_09465 [Calothrix sp. HK-06]
MTEPHKANGNAVEAWPSLPFDKWKDTYATLHMWTQIIGKIRLVQSPFLNHWWHVPLYVTVRGLTTSVIPYGSKTFEINFDFIDHKLVINTLCGSTKTLSLRSQSVADFYQETMTTLRSLGIEVNIWTTPVEVADPIPFEEDYKHATYDPEYAQRFFRILVQANRVLTEFRSQFIGKVSPVHFFWGSFDLAVTRFSGQPGPEHPGGIPNMADWVTREAYSHEVSSCGFWPGNDGVEPVFYSYAYPTPSGFKEYSIEPFEASYSDDLGEFVLPYDAVRTSQSPDELLLTFFESTYKAAANLGNWDRATLERTRLKQ